MAYSLSRLAGSFEAYIKNHSTRLDVKRARLNNSIIDPWEEEDSLASRARTRGAGAASHHRSRHTGAAVAHLQHEDGFFFFTHPCSFARADFLPARCATGGGTSHPPWLRHCDSAGLSVRERVGACRSRGPSAAAVCKQAGWRVNTNLASR